MQRCAKYKYNGKKKKTTISIDKNFISFLDSQKEKIHLERIEQLTHINIVSNQNYFKGE